MTGARPVVDLELHTADRAAAGAFYASLLRWRPELIEARSGSWLGPGPGGGGAGGGGRSCARRDRGHGWPPASAEGCPVASANVEPKAALSHADAEDAARTP